MLLDIHHRVCLVAAFVLAIIAGDFLTAQEADKPASEAAKSEKAAAEEPATTAADKDYASLHAEWKSLDSRLNELQKTYRETSSAAARAEVKRQYQELVDRSQTLLPELEAAARKEYEANPGKDAELERLLIGMVAYAFRRDDYDAALDLAGFLGTKGCDEPALFAVAGKAAYNADDYETAERYLTQADQAGKLDGEGKQLLADLPEQKKAWETETTIRAKEAEANDLPQVKIETNEGTIVVELFENEAPQTVGNFVNLVEKGFYNGLTFHRVLPGFMAQGGDPEGTGGGGPGYEIYCECYKPEYRRHFRGTLSMAHAGKDTGGSQFFITFRPTTHLNGKHTAFGRVIAGMDVLPKLQRRDPGAANPPEPDKIVKAEVVRKREHPYEPVKVQ